MVYAKAQHCDNTTSLLEAVRQRTLIIGNSGSGKSSLAERLSVQILSPIFDLDTVHWQGNDHGLKQDPTMARQKVFELAAQERWVMEGVYGWLAEVAVPRATAVIWLDIPWDVCKDGLLARGQRPGGSDVDFSNLLGWAEPYWSRQTSTSFSGHQRLFEACGAAKLRIRS